LRIFRGFAGMTVSEGGSTKDGDKHAAALDSSSSGAKTHYQGDVAEVDSIEQKLERAMRRNDELLKNRNLLTARVSLLESALLKAHRFAHYDELTGLPNRRLLLDRFIQASALAIRNGHQLALLFFDLNDFKGVNDKLGHKAGDKLLQQVATRLSSSIRISDTACRYGGDEFVVLLTEIQDPEHVVDILQKIARKLTPTYEVEQFAIRISVSDGLAIYPDDAQCFSDLLQLSDRVMLGVKANSRGRAGDTNKVVIWPHDSKTCENR
ncbi:MAG: GGDEF domain-containing protein, partial [Woeseia sp.]